MAKQTGLGDQLFIQGTDVGADIQQIGSLATPVAVIESTGITKFAMERLHGIRDGNAEFVAFFNDELAGTHHRLKLLPRTDVHLMYLRGTTLGAPAVGMVGKQVDYAPTRGDDGSLTFSVNALANAYGIDWGLQVTPGKTTHTAADSNDTAADFGTGTKAFGFQAYLQVFSIGSGTATVTLQESQDPAGAPDTFANISGGSFAAVTAAGAQRIQSVSDTLSVERYIRVITTGTFTNLVFAVVVCRNDALRAI